MRPMNICFVLLVAFLCLRGYRGSDTEVIYGWEDPSKNLVQNWDFEEDLAPHWKASRAQLSFDDDHFTGSRSVRVYDRTHRFGSIQQRIPGVKSATTYYLSAYLKLPNAEGRMFYMVKLWLDWKAKAGEVASNGRTEGRIPLAKFPKARGNDEWRQIGGDWISPDCEVEYYKMYIEVDALDVDYLIDTVSLAEIPEDPNWKQTANDNIKKYRTNGVTLSGEIPDGIPPCRTEVSVKLTKRHFMIGSAIQANKFTETSELGDRYRDFIFTHFDWAVCGNSMKWRPMEGSRGHPIFDRVDKTLDLLEAHNLTARAHAMLWDVSKNNPNWVQSLSGEEMYNEIMKRIEYVVSHYADRVDEWDVVNEWLHGKFYEKATQNAMIQDEVFKLAHQLDPHAKLVINDYQALRLGDYTSAVVDQVKDLQSRNIPVGGIGIQSHLRAVPYKANRLAWRVHIAAASGLPISITEMSVHTTDVNLRASELEKAMRIYYSSEHLDGIMLWFFSDVERMRFEDTMVLFEGEQFVPNKAGQVLLDLLKEWKTDETFAPEDNSFSRDIVAHHGHYDVQVSYKGKPVKSQSFYLNPGGDINVKIRLKRGDFDDAFDGDASSC